MGAMSELLRVGAGFELAAVDPASMPGVPLNRTVQRDPKAWSRAQLADLGVELADRQEQLFANARCNPAERRRVLLVLQAMDCGGKDATVKNVAGMMNPQGLRITSFGPPTEEERRQHILWRIRQALPERGLVGMFNRSHYEDVLVVRVRKLVPKRVWQPRYAEINEFERELVDTGFVLVKVMLHISYEEQRRRLLQRVTDPTKYWKHDPEDVDNRAYWPAYMQAYQDALTRCGTDHAPWYVVPADRKWYRNWAVSQLVLEAMRGLNLAYPPPAFDPQIEQKRLQADK